MTKVMFMMPGEVDDHQSWCRKADVKEKKDLTISSLSNRLVLRSQEGFFLYDTV